MAQCQGISLFADEASGTSLPEQRQQKVLSSTDFIFTSILWAKEIVLDKKKVMFPMQGKETGGMQICLRQQKRGGDETGIWRRFTGKVCGWKGNLCEGEGKARFPFVWRTLEEYAQRCLDEGHCLEYWLISSGLSTRSLGHWSSLLKLDVR